MYKGFNLENISKYDLLIKTNENKSFEKYNYSNFKQIEKSLTNFILNDGSIKAKEIQNDWFPDIKADIFISHSHKDEKLAIKLGDWLFNNFELKSFIDSTVWKYSKDLLNKILSNNETYIHRIYTDEVTYKYNETLNMSSHIDMILSTSIIKIIDNCECLFFLNTPNSINEKDAIENETYSQWIYLETYISSIINIKKPDRLTQEDYFSYKSDTIEYNASIEHLHKLTNFELKKWLDSYNDKKTNNQLDDFQNSFNKYNPLDILYEYIDKNNKE